MNLYVVGYQDWEDVADDLDSAPIRAPYDMVEIVIAANHNRAWRIVWGTYDAPGGYIHPRTVRKVCAVDADSEGIPEPDEWCRLIELAEDVIATLRIPRVIGDAA